MKPQPFAVENIAVIQSPYKQKFAIPRQPGLVKQAVARLHFVAPYNKVDMVRGLEQFSHLWLLFMFHQNLAKGWTPTIRPPRLGGNKKIGVLASRATFRPNGIGMSAVELLDIEYEKNGPVLVLGGVDLLDKTPIIDIKPYIPYSDIVESATGGYAEQSPDNQMPVIFSPEALNACSEVANEYPNLQDFISEILSQDPRPAYKKNTEDNKVYNVELYDFDISWQVIEGVNQVLTIKPL